MMSALVYLIADVGECSSAHAVFAVKVMDGHGASSGFIINFLHTVPLYAPHGLFPTLLLLKGIREFLL